MNRLIFISCYILLVITFSCGASQEDSISSDVKTRHLMVDGKPFLMLGGQLRTDFFLQLDKKAPEELDKYFALANTMNVTVVQVPVCWRDIETRKDVYDGTLVEKYIELCDRYDLKLEILWFGSYMCGYSVEGYLPDYIVYNTVLYPELRPSADFQGWLGKHYYLKPNTPALVDREEKAIAFMMDVVYQYDATHDKRHTLIGVQVENEPDMLVTRHNNEHGYTQQQLWPDLTVMLGRLGQAVKKSDYKCYTRVNLVLDNDYLHRCKDLVATQGIDYVGLDPYHNKIADIATELLQLQNIEGNYAHIAENGGEYVNTDLLALKALTLGCGYEVFEVITTPHPFLMDWTLRGVWNPDFTPKKHTQRIIDAFKIYKQAWVDLASADTVNILGFNLKNNDGLEQTKDLQQTSHVIVKWRTTTRGVAFAVEHNGHITVASTQKDEMEFSDNIYITKIEKGYYNMEGVWISTNNGIMDNGNYLKLEPCVVYRLHFVLKQ